jgi:hypothetical protein
MRRSALSPVTSIMPRAFSHAARLFCSILQNPIRNLGAKVLPRFIDAHERCPNASQHDFSRLYIKRDITARGTGVGRLVGAARMNLCPRPRTPHMEGVIEFHDHIAAKSCQLALARIDAAHLAPTHDLVVSSIDGQGTVASAGVVLHIDPRGVAAVKCKPQQTATRSSRDRCSHAKIRKLDLVEIRCGVLRVVRKPRSRRVALPRERIRSSEQLETAIILHCRATQKVAAANSAKRLIGVIVGDYAFSLRILCCGRPLRHPKRHAHARICLPFSGSSHPRVHQICELLAPKHYGQEKMTRTFRRMTDIHLFSFGVMRTFAPSTNVAT